MDDNGIPRERFDVNSTNVNTNDSASSDSYIDISAMSELEAEKMKQQDMIFDDMIKLLTEMLDISPTDIEIDMKIFDDLDLDSLQVYELVVDLEEVYNIRMSDDELDKVRTIRDVVDLVYKLTNS